MRQQLSVASGAEDVPACLETGPQAGMIEQFAVEDSPYCFRLIGHGLLPADGIDDCETGGCHVRRTIAAKATLVRTAVLDRADHPLQGA
jgi:hypothetical protein